SRFRIIVAAAVFAVAAAKFGIPTQAQQAPTKGGAKGGGGGKGKAAPAPVAAAPSLPTGFITGTVQGDRGPEAGGLVLAETKDLPTNFIKIVVTDDQGRFALPQLPEANYKVWVRGYGLSDSTPVDGKVGGTLALKASNAKTPQEAAKVYPGDYWFSMMEP